MATTTSITTTYAGEAAAQFISPALLSGATIENGGISVKPNIKYKEVIKKLSTNDIVKDATCDFDATSTITLTERVLTPEYQQVNLQLCKKDFTSDWQALEMGLSAHHNLPSSFADYLISYVAAKVAERTETSIWQGATSSNGQFDGFSTLLAADANLPSGNEVTGTTVTSANAIAEIQKVVDAIPNAVYGKQDLKVFVSNKIAKAYIAAQAALGYRDNYHVGQSEMNFQGVPLFVAPGLGDNVMVAAETSNLYFGTSLLSDHQEVKVLDMSDLDGSDNVRVVMRFTAGVQYGSVEDIVTYGIVNSAN
jgi:hypothetical protein